MDGAVTDPAAVAFTGEVARIVAEVTSWDLETLVNACRAACPYLSDEWELATWTGLDSSPKKARNELERLIVRELTKGPDVDDAEGDEPC